MFNKSMIILAIFLVGLLAFSAVSAADNVTDDVAGAENVIDDVAIADATEEAADTDDSKLMEQSDNVEVIGSTDDTISQSPGNGTPVFEGTFSYLRNEIGSGGNINLTKFTYTYDEGDTIEITTPGVIRGNGITVIDMKNANVLAFKISAENVTFEGITFRNMYYNGYGGGIYFDAPHGTVKNCCFNDNYAISGSSIYINDDYCTVVDCNFTNNVASNIGGSIYYDGEYLSLINCNFISNTAVNDGGAVCILGRYSTVRNCNFKDNSARYGGAICFLEDGNVNDCYFEGNNAEEGGAISFWEDGNVSNCCFEGNNAEKGGAIYIYEAILGVIDSTFNNNKADFMGGAIHVFDAILSVIDSTFTNNDASGGGAINVYRGKATVIDSNFTNNSAYCAGAINVDEGMSSVIHSTFIFNTAEDSGGAMCDASAIDCTFKFNSAGNSGGALFLGNATGCTFVGNYAQYGGALMGTAFEDCTFENNTAQQGSDFYFMSHIKCDDVTAFYNASDFLVIHLTDNIDRPIGNATISVDLNGVINLTTDAAGQAKFPIAGLNPNSYLTVISFAGNDYCQATYNLAYVNILKLSSIITAPSVTAEYGDQKYLVATLIDINGNPVAGVNVTVELAGGVFTLTTGADGKVRVSTAGLPLNVYTAVISFAGNDYINGSSAEANVTISKISTKLAANSVATVYNTERFLVAALQYNNGTAIVGANVTVSLAGGVFTLTTGADGKVRVSTAGLLPDVYFASIKYAGTDLIKASSVTAKVTVDKITSRLTASSIVQIFNNGKTLVATLKDVNGNNLKGKVTFKLSNGYTKIVNVVNGQAKLSVPATLVPKVYTATITFAGDEIYKSATLKNVKVTVKKDNTKLVASNKAFTVKATKKVTAILKDSKGRVIKNKYVSFTVDGKTYKVKTGVNGVATATVKITKKGIYKTSVSFAGDNYYNKAAIKTIKLTVK